MSVFRVFYLNGSSIDVEADWMASAQDESDYNLGTEVEHDGLCVSEVVAKFPQYLIAGIVRRENLKEWNYNSFNPSFKDSKLDPLASVDES